MGLPGVMDKGIINVCQKVRELCRKDLSTDKQTGRHSETSILHSPTTLLARCMTGKGGGGYLMKFDTFACQYF